MVRCLGPPGAVTPLPGGISYSGWLTWTEVSAKGIVP